MLARFLYVSRNLLSERFDVFELFLRPQELHEFYFDIAAVNVAMKIEKMNFDRALGLFAGNSRSESHVDDAVMEHAFEPGLDEVNAVGRKLLAVRTQICRWKT